MKTKKFLAMLAALSMVATTIATTSVLAEDELVNISSTATLSSNGNVYWSLAYAADGDNTTIAGIYGYKEGDYIQADFGTEKVIRDIDVQNSSWWGYEGTGKVKSIQLSNDPNFGTYEEMVCYERVGGDSDHFDRVDCWSKWSYDGRVPYRYLRLYATPANASYVNYSSDTTPCFAFRDMIVYAEDDSKWVNLSGTATMSTNGDDSYWPINQAADGIYDNTAGIYGALEDYSYMQADLGRPQEIKTMRVVNSTYYGWLGTGRVKRILVSNDPNFNTYEEMVCYNRIIGATDHTELDCQSFWACNGTYRYIRLYGTTGPAAYTNYGIDQTPCFAICELDIYAIETPYVPEEPVKEIEITEVNMGTYEGKAWDVTVNEFDSAKIYTANFTDGEEVKEGAIDFTNVETEGSVAFAVFLHTSRANVALDIVAE